ncbi:MAG: O-antigen ligase family protein [Burkholderiales bacterium]
MQWPVVSALDLPAEIHAATASRSAFGARHEAAVAAILFAYPVVLLIWRGASNILFAVLVVYSLALLYSGRRHWQPWDRDTLSFALAMALPTAAVAFSQWSHMAFNIKPYDSALTTLLCVPVYLMLRRTGPGKISVLQYAFPAAAIAACAYLALFGNYVEGRLTSSFLNSIHLGDLALVLGVLSLASIRLAHEDSAAEIAIKFAGFLAGAYLSLLSQSRGGWIALPVIAIVWVFYSRFKHKGAALAIAGPAIAALCVASYLWIDIVHQRTGAVFADLSSYQAGHLDTSIGLRLQIWKAAFHLIGENPWFGVGPDGFARWMAPLVSSGLITPEAGNLGRAEVHNEILLRTVNMGIFGLISILSVYIVPVVIFARARTSASAVARRAGLMGLCHMACFITFGLTVEILNLKMTLVFFALILTVLLALTKNVHLEAESRSEVPVV